MHLNVSLSAIKSLNFAIISSACGATKKYEKIAKSRVGIAGMFAGNTLTFENPNLHRLVDISLSSKKTYVQSL